MVANELDALLPESVTVAGSAEGMFTPEEELGIAFRVRRRAVRGILRLYWWSMVNCVAWIFIYLAWGYSSNDATDFFTVLSVLILFVASGLVVVIGGMANSSEFEYRPWESVGFLFAVLMFVLPCVFGGILLLGSLVRSH